MHMKAKIRGWHEATEMQVKKLASAQASQTGKDQSDATRHLYQKLAVFLAKVYLVWMALETYLMKLTSNPEEETQLKYVGRLAPSPPDRMYLPCLQTSTPDIRLLS